MSAAQLIVLTSLVAVIRGVLSLRPSPPAKNRLAVFLDVILAGLVIGAGIFFARHKGEITYSLYYGSPGGIHAWIQDNLGTVVFGAACLILALVFRLSLAREWSAASLKPVFEWLDPLMMAGTIALILITYFVRTYYIPSPSMVPTLQVHDYIIVAKPFVLRLFHDYPPRRGDIVVFHPPIPGETREFIKRVVGQPEEILSVHDHQVFIDGKPIREPYINNTPDYDFGPIKIPKNDYIVFGDNRRDSEDSHAWPETGGSPFLSLRRIEGRAVVIFFPFWRIRLFHG